MSGKFKPSSPGALTDVASVGESRSTRRPGALIEPLRLAVQPVEQNVGKRIEHRVRHGREERERAGRDGSEELKTS